MKRRFGTSRNVVLGVMRRVPVLRRAVRWRDELLLLKRQLAATSPGSADAPRIERQVEKLEARIATLKRQHRQVLNVLGTVSSGSPELSLTPGVTEWRDRWVASPGRRILMFCYADFAGSFYRWATAINRHSDYAARVVAFSRQRMGEPSIDLLYPHGSVLGRTPSSYVGLTRLLDEADLIHLKDQTGFVLGTNALPRYFLEQFDKPLVFTHYGGNSRRDEQEGWYRDYVASFDARVAMTPDLCYEWADWEFIPHAIDTEELPFTWADGSLLLHTPSRPERKGTDEFREAVDSLPEHLSVSAEVLSGVPHELCVARKREATLFFDQAGREREELGSAIVGWYGNSALEAAVHGIPTMAHLSEEAFKRAANSGRDIEDECAILNVQPTAASIADRIAWFFALDPADRQEVAESTRRWVEDFHSYQVVGERLGRLYERLISASTPG